MSTKSTAMKNIFVNANLDEMSEVQELYDDNFDEGEGEDEVMDWYEVIVQEAMKQLGGALNGDIEFEGERSGLIASFSFSMTYKPGDKKRLDMEKLFRCLADDIITPDDSAYEEMLETLEEFSEE
jgi:hypothetical protein